MSLEIVSLHNHGKADEEYVLLRTTSKVDLHDYILFDDTYNENHKPSNIHRHMYWFPKVPLDAGWEIYLYTREGTNMKRKNRNICNLFWNSKTPVWNNEKDTTYLLKVMLVDSKTMS